MKIFNRTFEKKLIERSLEYINTFKEFDYELKEQEFHEYYNKDNLSIKEIKINMKNGKNINIDNISSIKIEYSIEKPSYCSGYGDEMEEFNYQMTLPSFLFAEEEKYKYIFDNLLDEKKEEKRNKEQKEKIEDLKKLKELSEKLGYEIKRIEK